MLQLSYLNVRNNKLIGTLPSVWSSLEQVRILLLHLHCLTTTLKHAILFAPSLGLSPSCHQLEWLLSDAACPQSTCESGTHLALTMVYRVQFWVQVSGEYCFCILKFVAVAVL